MSTAVFSAVARFGPLIRDSKRVEDALGGVQRAARDANRETGPGFLKGVERGADRLDRVGTKMSDLGRGASTRMTLPVAAAGAAMVHTYAKFEASIIAAGTKTDATRKQTEQMRDLAIDWGKKSKFSASESAAAMDLMAAAGLNANETMKALPAVISAAQASGEDLALTGDTIVRTMNAFGQSADKAPHVADVFANVANTTALSMQGISEAIGQVGEVGSRFGQELEPTLAVVGRLVDLGVPAASAGTAVRQALTSLASPNAKQADLLDELGIKTRDQNDQLLQLPDLLENVKKGLDSTNPAYARLRGIIGMNEEELKAWAERQGVSIGPARDLQRALASGSSSFADYTTKTLFGVEGAKAFSLAMSDGKPVVLDSQKDAEKLTRLQDGLAKTMGVKQAKAWIAARTEQGRFTAKGPDAVRAVSAMSVASDGLSAKIGKAMGKGTGQKIDNFKGALESLALSLVTSVAPTLNRIIEGSTKLVDRLDDLAKKDGFGPLIVGAAVFLAALGPVMIVLGAMIRAFGTVFGLAGKIGSKVMPKRGPPATGGTPSGSAAAGLVQVYWTKAMPVYMGKAAPGAGGSRPAGGAAPAYGSPGWSTQGGGSHADWVARNKETNRARRRETIGRVAAGGRRQAGIAGGVGAGAAVTTLAVGGSAGDAAKFAGIAAGVELVLAAVMAASRRLGPMLTGLAGRAASSAGRGIAALARLGAAWVASSLTAIASAGRMALAWARGVLIPAAVSMGRMALAAGLWAAKWALMAVQALLQAARMAAAWLIAMGPIGWVIAAVIGLALIIWANWDKIKRWTAAAWTWVWDKVKWLATKALDLFKRWTLVGVIMSHWDEIKSKIAAAIANILTKIQPLLDVIDKVQGFAGAGISKVGGALSKVPGLAGGGTVTRTGVALVGEQGPELLTLPKGSAVTNARGTKRVMSQAAALTTAATTPRGGGTAPNPYGVMSAVLGGSTGTGTGTDRFGRPRPPSPPAGAKAGVNPRGGGGNLTIPVYNPVPERASTSVSKVLRDKVDEEGWAR